MAFRKLGVDYFSKYLERIVENKRGDMEEEKKRSISLLFISLYIPHSYSITLFIATSLNCPLFEVGTPPPHDSVTPHRLVDDNTTQGY